MLTGCAVSAAGLTISGSAQLEKTIGKPLIAQAAGAAEGGEAELAVAHEQQQLAVAAAAAAGIHSQGAREPALTAAAAAQSWSGSTRIQTRRSRQQAS